MKERVTLQITLLPFIGVVKPHPMLCVDLIACRRKGLTNFMMNLHLSLFHQAWEPKEWALGFLLGFMFLGQQMGE